jgi:Probable sensor domain DACNK/DisA bacterial checkpoint controller nucleotide-binding
MSDELAEPGPLRRLAEELEEDGVHLPADGPLRMRILDELDHARRPPVHETRRPIYGSLILPPERSLLVGGDLVELHDLNGYDRERARSFADGRSSFLVHRDGPADTDSLALAHFRRSVQMEADLVEIQEATDAFIIQRTLLGRPRLFMPNAVVDWNGREWTLRPNAAALLDPLSKIVPTASYDVLRGLLELSVHWLAPGHVGATLVLRLDGIEPANDPGYGFDAVASFPSPSLSIRARHHYAALLTALAQTDLATLVDADGTVRHFGVGLNVSARADLLVGDPRGMRHRSARRFTFDHPETVAFVVSEDGPVTVFSDGAAVVACDPKLKKKIEDSTMPEYTLSTRRCVDCDKLLVVIPRPPGRGPGSCPVCATTDGLAAHKVLKVRKEWPAASGYRDDP